MKRLPFLILLAVIWAVSAYPQDCSSTSMTLKSQQSSGGCGPGSPFAQRVPTTLTNTFTDTCSTTANAASSPSTQYFTIDSTVMGHGQCEVFATSTVSCPPQMVNSVTAATGPTDYNRFYNQAYDMMVSFDSSGNATCVKTPNGFNQDFQQCAGQACASTGGGGGGGGDPCLGGGGGGFQPGSGPTPDPECSPIVIDTEQEGFHLTSAGMGVSFDISGTGHLVQIAWTDSQFHNAFLALPGADGLVHNGQQLFGNFTPQPNSPHPNGFLALAQFDKPENGGNGDGIIDDKDAIFSELRLWIDANHDGICQPNELHRLPEFGIYSLSITYTESSRTDQFGNQFRYRGQVNPGERRDPRDETAGGEPGRWEYDVFLTVK